MSMLVRAMACAVAMLAVLSVTRAAQACSVCLAGDPIFDNHGTTVQEAGAFSVYVEASGWSKTSGLGEHPAEEEEEAAESSAAEENRSQRLDIFLSWAPRDRVSLTLDVPFAFNRIREFDHDGSVEFSEKGLGDVSVSSSVVLWRNRPVLPDTWLEGRAFLKFPTGKSNELTQGVLDKHIQAGTGSWDFGVGLAGVHKFEWGSAYASVFGRVSTAGSLDYEYGDVVLANLATLVPLGHVTGLACLDRLTAGLELNYRWADHDDEGGHRFAHSGGSILYATPSLRVRLPWFAAAKAPSLRAAVQVPFTSRWLNGFQDEDARWLIGLHFPL